MGPAETSIGILVVVALIAWGMKALSGESRTVAPPPEAPPELDDDEDVEGESVAVTSDGWAFLPDRDTVHLVPPGDDDDVFPSTAPVTLGEGRRDPAGPPGLGPPVNPRTGRRLATWKPGEHLAQGDLVAARVRRGSPDAGAWWLEAIGRDGEFREWPFENEEAARAAWDLLQKRTVRAPMDDEGEPRRYAEADYAEARRTRDLTEQELATMPEEEGDER